MKITQCEMIEDYLDTYHSITPLEAMRDLGIMRLASRIAERKKEKPPTVANPDAPTETDFKYFTAEQVRNMSHKEVRENYSDIMKSMKKW